jgi:hypothetical protein
MAKRQRQDATERTADQLRTLTIVQLGLAGVGQREIRSIVGCDMTEVNAIVKLLRRRKEQA